MSCPDGESSITESPQSVVPFHGAFPVATRRFPLPGTTTAPPRPQIPASLALQDDGERSLSRFEQSAFQTWRSRPAAEMIATCPWYGAASKKLLVVTRTSPFAKLSDDEIFSRLGSRVTDTRHETLPSATESFWIFPSGEAA